MKITQILIIAGVGTALYLLLKPKNQKPTPTQSAPIKPNCAAVGKVNCKILDDNGQPTINWCCGKYYYNNTKEW